MIAVITLYGAFQVCLALNFAVLWLMYRDRLRMPLLHQRVFSEAALQVELSLDETAVFDAHNPESDGNIDDVATVDCDEKTCPVVEKLDRQSVYGLDYPFSVSSALASVPPGNHVAVNQKCIPIHSGTVEIQLAQDYNFDHLGLFSHASQLSEIHPSDIIQSKPVIVSMMQVKPVHLAVSSDASLNTNPVIFYAPWVLGLKLYSVCAVLIAVVIAFIAGAPLGWTSVAGMSHIGYSTLAQLVRLSHSP